MKVHLELLKACIRYYRWPPSEVANVDTLDLVYYYSLLP